MMSTHLKSPTLEIGKNSNIDQFGFGTWNLRGRSGQAAIEYALEVGYRHLDSADLYRNHRSVAAAIKNSGLNREEIFIVSKLWSNSLEADQVGPAVERFLMELNTDYLDLLLIHWPAGSTPITDTLKAMHAVREAGGITHIGVSNFGVAEMQEALDSGVPVSNNQVEFNLRRPANEVLDFCLANGISVTAYTPLLRGSSGQERIIAEIADKYEATREQVLLNWLMAKQMIVIPRSTNRDHIRENWEALGWEMDAEDVDKIEQAL